MATSDDYPELAHLRHHDDHHDMLNATEFWDLIHDIYMPSVSTRRHFLSSTVCKDLVQQLKTTDPLVSYVPRQGNWYDRRLCVAIYHHFRSKAPPLYARWQSSRSVTSASCVGLGDDDSALVIIDKPVISHVMAERYDTAIAEMKALAIERDSTIANLRADIAELSESGALRDAAIDSMREQWANEINSVVECYDAAIAEVKAEASKRDDENAHIHKSIRDDMAREFAKLSGIAESGASSSGTASNSRNRSRNVPASSGTDDDTLWMPYDNTKTWKHVGWVAWDDKSAPTIIVKGPDRLKFYLRGTDPRPVGRVTSYIRVDGFTTLFKGHRSTITNIDDVIAELAKISIALERAKNSDYNIAVDRLDTHLQLKLIREKCTTLGIAFTYFPNP